MLGAPAEVVNNAPLEARTGLVTIILVSSLAFLLFQARLHVLTTLELQEARLAYAAAAFRPPGDALAPVLENALQPAIAVPLPGSSTVTAAGSPADIPRSAFDELGLSRADFVDTGGRFVILHGRLFASIVAYNRVAMIMMPLGAVATGIQWRMAADIVAVVFLGFLMLLIRESRMSDYEVRRLLDASPVALFVLDTKGRTQFANRAALELFHGSTAASLDQFGADLMARSDIFDWLKTKPSVGELTEMRDFDLPSGRHLTVSRHYVMVRSRLITIGSAVDITVRHEAEKALTKARDAAEALGRMKSESLAMISHELKTPVSGVLGLAQLLSAEPLPDKARHVVRRMIQAGKTLAVIINDIVDLAILEAGHLRLDHIGFDPRETIATAVTLASAAASQKGLAVHVNIDPSVPLAVAGDPARLQQIIINLVGNGIKFTDAGHIEVRARAKELADGGVELSLDVADTGIGIAPDIMPRLFQPFSQGDTSHRRRHEGTGLGLAISKRLAEAMCGEISVQSELGAGTTFQVSLRLARAELPPAASRALALRVLVVDDVPLNLDVVSGLLRVRGCSTVAVASGEEAFAALKESSFDLVLMDIRMPGIDGLDTTAAIRADFQAAQNAGMIVGLTANPLPTDRPLYALRGFDEVIGKPVDLDHLERIVASRSANHPEETPHPERIEVLRQRLGPARALRILDAFSVVASQAAETIASSCSRLDFADVRDAAHRLSGAASNIGLMELSDEAVRLEDAAEAKDTLAIADISTSVIRMVVATQRATGTWIGVADIVTSQKDILPHELW